MYNRLLISDDISKCYQIIQEEKWPEKGFKHIDLWTKDAAIIKWVTVLNEFKSIGKNNLKVIDLGSSTGVVPHIIASWGNDVTGIDLLNIDHWCPKGFAKMILGDALYELKKIEDESIDVITDLCAVHEFNTNSDEEFENIGWKEVSEQVYRVLKPGGILLISTDVILSSGSKDGGFISPENLIKIIEKSRLKLTTQYKKEYEKNPYYQHDVGLYIVTLSFEK